MKTNGKWRQVSSVCTMATMAQSPCVKGVDTPTLQHTNAPTYQWRVETGGGDGNVRSRRSLSRSQRSPQSFFFFLPYVHGRGWAVCWMVDVNTATVFCAYACRIVTCTSHYGTIAPSHHRIITPSLRATLQVYEWTPPERPPSLPSRPCLLCTSEGNVYF